MRGWHGDHLAGLAVGVGLLVLAGCLHAHGREGWQDRPLVCDPKQYDADELKDCQKWLGNVLQPNSRTSCCGEADAFLADAFERGPGGELIAVITKDYPGKPAGTKITIPFDRVNPPKDINGKSSANPTGHGIVFISTASDHEDIVLCYFGPTLS